jgi:hypothetical protein
VYEPFDGVGYLPDFCFTIPGRTGWLEQFKRQPEIGGASVTRSYDVGERNLLVEVKPVATVEEAKNYLPKILTGIDGLWKSDVIVCGLNPSRTLYVDFLNGPDDWHTSEAVLSNCPLCHDSLNLHQEYVGYGCTKCNYGKWAPAAPDGYVDMLWRKAGNDTRWTPAA